MTCCTWSEISCVPLGSKKFITNVLMFFSILPKKKKFDRNGELADIRLVMIRKRKHRKTQGISTCKLKLSSRQTLFCNLLSLFYSEEVFTSTEDTLVGSRNHFVRHTKYCCVTGNVCLRIFRSTSRMDWNGDNFQSLVSR